MSGNTGLTLANTEYPQVPVQDMSSDIDSYANVVHAPLTYETTSMPVTATPVHQIQPAATWVPGPITRSESFLDDYYYRIHTFPAVLSAGNILQRQTKSFYVWNSFFEPKQLDSVTARNSDGLTLTEPQQTPFLFNALSELEYQIEFDTDGPPAIEASYTFDFLGLDPVRFEVTGRRIVVFPFMPQAGYDSSLEFRTDIVESFADEQRYQLRQHPRESISYSCLLDQQAYSRAKVLGWGWSHRLYAVPVWAESEQVGGMRAGITELSIDTTTASYGVDDVLVIWQSDTHFEALQIAQIDAGKITLAAPTIKDYSNAYVAPTKLGRASSGFNFGRNVNTFIDLDVDFEAIQPANLTYNLNNYPLYKDSFVLEHRSIVSSSLRESIDREVDVIDNSRSNPFYDVKYSQSRQEAAIRWVTKTKQDTWDLRNLMHELKGRYREFYLPTFNQDFVLSEPISENATSMTVKWIGYSLYYTIKDIRIKLKDGTIFYRRTLSGADQSNGNETISIDAPLNIAVAVDDIDIICFMNRVRLQSDRVQFRHEAGHRVELSTRALELFDA